MSNGEVVAEEFRKPDQNTRVVTSLSQGIARHSQIEASVANLSMLDVNNIFPDI